MKHPNKSGRGKHFTRGKYKEYIKDNGRIYLVKTKIRRTSRARIKIYIYDGLTYKVRYNKIKVLCA